MRFTKNLLFLFAMSFITTFSLAQYYEFTGNSNNGFQQGCAETYDVYFNTEGVSGITVGQPLVILDNTKIEYATGGNLKTNLFNLYTSNPSGFTDWVSQSYPQWAINYTKIFLNAQNESNSAVGGYHKYGSLIFQPKYDYDEVSFVFDYNGGNQKTSLAKDGNNMINPISQSSRLTGTINVYREPCLNDTTGPSILINTPSGSNYLINNGLDIDLKDSIGNGTTPYVYTGGGLWTGNIWGVNNQYGIDSGTVSVTVSGNGQTRTLNQIDFNWTPSNKTWQYKDRDYNIKLPSSSLFDFGIEEPIQISATVSDRNNNLSNFLGYSFNAPIKPYVSNLSPFNGQTFVLLNSDVHFDVNDAWAGVDTGTVILTLSGISQTTSGYYHIYSGTDLNFVLNHGSFGIGNSGGYTVSVNPMTFPSSGTIAASVYVKDLKGNIFNRIWTFSTRLACEDMACCEPIILQTGNESTQYLYLNNTIYISGGINPYLDWTIGNDTGYLFCNTALQGLSIYSGNGNDSGSAIFTAYQELSDLYFSGTNIKVLLTGENFNTIILYRFGDFTIKIYQASRGNTTNPNLGGFENRGRILFYVSGDRGVAVYSGYVDTDNYGSGDVIEDVAEGYYDVVYKGWHQLSSVISGIYITGGQEILLDFTTGSNLYGAEEGISYMGGNLYQIGGDMLSSNNEYDYQVNSTDLSVLYGSQCPYGAMVGSIMNSKHKCDLNNDGRVDSSDASVIISSDWRDDFVYGTGSSFSGFGLTSY